MDIRTGRMYETREAAQADGVPDADIAEVTVRRDGTYWPKFDRSRHQPHQGHRELARRLRRMPAGA